MPTANNTRHINEPRNVLPGAIFHYLDLDDIRRAPQVISVEGHWASFRSLDTPLYNTYDIITQGSRPPRVCYGDGAPFRLVVSSILLTPYRPAREIPLTSRDACRCEHYDFEVRPWRLYRNHPEIMINEYERERVDLARQRALGQSGAFNSWRERQLVEMREARGLAGLNTSEYDWEIARRVLEDPPPWGWVGKVMAGMGWVMEAEQVGRECLGFD